TRRWPRAYKAVSGVDAFFDHERQRRSPGRRHDAVDVEILTARARARVHPEFQIMRRRQVDPALDTDLSGGRRRLRQFRPMRALRCPPAFDEDIALSAGEFERGHDVKSRAARVDLVIDQNLPTRVELAARSNR